MKKTVLIVTYYWPPAGGPGVQRWLKFVKYLPQFNVEPIIYIPENPNYPIIDESLQNEVSPSLSILKHPISEPYKWAGLFSKHKAETISKGIITEAKQQGKLEQLLLYIRGNFFIPDARKSWVNPSVNYLKEYLQTHSVDTLITTGPPHSLHLIGLKLKANLNINWIADFRDPWTTIGYHKELKLSASSKKKHKILEHKVLNSADAIIVTSEVTKSEFKAITDKPIHVITNGYDVYKTEAVKLDKKFTIAHIGSLLSKRNPKMLWRVLSDLIKERKEFAQDFQLNIIGNTGEDVIESIKKFGLSKHFNYLGYVPHKKAITHQRNSQILLLIEIDSEETKCIIPGKLFEYMVSGRPIIALGPKGSDVENIINSTNTGTYFNYDNYNGLKQQILVYYKDYQNGTLQSHPIGLQKYSRKSLTETLSKLL